VAANHIANLMAQLEKLPGLKAANERLRGEIEGLRGELERVRAESERIRAENEELRTKLGMNSLNSSMPPSRDDSEARGKRRKKARSAKHARRRQKEARRKSRAQCSKLLPADALTSWEESRPTKCSDCGTRLRACHLLAEPERIQQYDLGNDGRRLAHEIRIFSAECPCCHAITKGPRPAAANTTKVRPVLRAFLLLLMARFALSRRDVIAFLVEVYGIHISLGLLSKIEKQVTKQMEEPYQEAARETQSAPVVYADETSWSYGGIPGWLWIATTGHVARFLIDDGRGSKAAVLLLGPDGESVVVSDRWVAYEHRGRRQVCWSHLDRNAQALVERGGGAARVGRRVLDFIQKMFRLWHRFLDGELTRVGMRNRVKALGRRMFEQLSRMRRLPPVAQRFIRGLRKVEAHLFTFTEVEGTEPTNNNAERGLRAAVIWRRLSQCTKSERGRRFVERALTVVMSLRAQGRNVFAFLRDMLSPDRQTPSLLPAA
jgi:transposase